VLGVALGVGDVVAVAEQHVVDAAETLQRCDHLAGPAGSVDHQVRAGAAHEIGVRAERRPGVVPEAVHLVAEVLGEHRHVRPLQGRVADRTGWAHHDRPPGHLDLVGSLGLANEDRVAVASVAHHQTRSNLPCRVAVDAATVDEPLAWRSGFVSFGNPRHGRRH